MKRTLGNVAKGLLLAALVVGGLACSDDGTNGARCLVFSPVTAPGEPNVLFRNGPSSTCELLEIEVVGNGVTNVIAFDANLTFSTGPIAFLGISLEDSVLTADGVSVSPIIEEEPAGNITIGLARQSSVGVDADDELITKLFFALGVSNGNSTLAIDPACLVSPGATPNDPPVANAAVCAGATVSAISE